MKTSNFLTLLLAIFLLPLGVQAVNSNPNKAVDPEDPVMLTAKELSKLKAKEYEELTGRDLTFKEKLGLMQYRKVMKKALRKGYIAEDMVLPVPARFSINWGAFVVGLLFSIIGVLVALLFFEDPDAWISALIGMVLGLILGITLIF